MDYDKLSDEELLNLYNQKVSASKPSVDYDSMSDEELLAAYQAKQKPEAGWLDVLQGGAAEVGNLIGTGLTQALAGLETARGKLPTDVLARGLLGQKQQQPNQAVLDTLFETKEGIRSTMEDLDPTRGKQLSDMQRVGKAGTQLVGALATGPVGLGGMMAGGTVREADEMLSEGMPVEKAQQYAAADAALNTGSIALGGFGKSRLAQGTTVGAGNMAADEAAHLLANQFRESEGLQTKTRDNVDRGISFGMGFVPGYIAQRGEVEAQVKPEVEAEANARQRIDEILAQKDPLTKPSVLELLPKEDYPEPLGNRSIDPDTKTVTTGMAEDVPTIDFPLRPEAMERDRKFQRLQKDLVIERQILEDYQDRGVDAEGIKQQEQAVEQARQAFGKYLDEGYGIKDTGDAYRGLYESGTQPSLAIERGFDPKTYQASKKELGLLPLEPVQSSNPKALADFVSGLQEVVKSGDYNGALDFIIKSRKDTMEGKVAELLRKVNDRSVKLAVGRNLALETPDKQLLRSDGLYIPNDHKVMIDSLAAGDVRTFLHEATHTATNNAIQFFLRGQTSSLSLGEKLNARRVVDLYNHVAEIGKKANKDYYGLRNASEFIAEAFSNPTFQEYLKTVNLPKGKIGTAWTEFTNAVRNLLGLDKKYNTALSEILSAGSKLIEESTVGTREGYIGGKHQNLVRFQPVASEQNPLRQFASYEQFRDSLPQDLRQYAPDYWVQHGRELPKEEATAVKNEAANKVVEKLIGKDSRVHYLTQDLRSAEEIKGVVLNHKDPKTKSPDITDNALRNNLASGGFAMSNLTQHPLVHWVTSKTMKALKESEIKSETAIAERGKGFLAILHQGTPDQIRDLSAKLLAIEGKDVDVRQQYKLSPWEDKVLASWEKAKNTAISDFNQMRQEKGLETIAPRMNYLASMFRGDFRMLVKKDGKTVGWINGNNKLELNQAKEYFKDAGYEFSSPKRLPYARSKDFQKMLGRKMAAFDEVINIFGASDPEVAKFAERMDSMLAKQAYDYLDFKQHFKEKSGVFGAEGMKAWKDAHENAFDLWEAQAEYIRTVNQWVAQQKVEPEIKQVLSDPEILSKAHNAAHLSKMIYDNSFGRLENTVQVLEAFADLFVAGVNSDIVSNTPGLRQLQKVNPFRGMQLLKNWALYSALSINPGFAFSQFAQVPHATSTMMQYFSDLGIKGNRGALAWGASDTANSYPAMVKLTKEIAKSLGEELPNGFVSEVGKYFVDYAKEKHIVNPHILEQVNIRGKNKASKMLQGVEEHLGNWISGPEEVTRTWAFTTLAHYLHSAGIPKEKAAEMAEVATSISMVDYSRQSRAMIYNRLGMLGDMAATVTTFKHNAYTQLATYGFNKAPKTALTMATIQLLMGGLVGMYAVDDVDDMLGMLKSMFPEALKDVQGLKEYIMRNADEFWAFGGLSSVSRKIMPEGIDLGTKFSMDNLFPDSPMEALFPLFSVLANTGEATKKFAMAPTATNAAGVAYPMMPAAIKGAMENTIFSDKEGGYIPSKTDQLKTRRSDNEQRLRLLGLRSLDERKESELIFRTRNSRLRDEELQQRYLDQIRTYNRSGNAEGLGQAVVKYMSNGGEWRNINTFIEKANRERVLDEVQRLSPKTLKTIRQQMQQQELGEFQQDLQ